MHHDQGLSVTKSGALERRLPSLYLFHLHNSYPATVSESFISSINLTIEQRSHLQVNAIARIGQNFLKDVYRKNSFNVDIKKHDSF